MTYTTYQPRPFPGMRSDGTLGTRYEVPFSSPGLIERDSVIVDDLNPQVVDTMIKAKIAQHEAIRSLGK